MFFHMMKKQYTNFPKNLHQNQHTLIPFTKHILKHHVLLPKSSNGYRTKEKTKLCQDFGPFRSLTFSVDFTRQIKEQQFSQLIPGKCVKQPLEAHFNIIHTYHYRNLPL